MGLLDEAIKEHLELKRRRGADPTEVARQESEALGPVRREAVDPEADEPAAEPAAEAPAAAPPAPEPEPLVPAPRDEERPHGDPLAGPPADEPAPEPAGPVPFGTRLDQPTRAFDPGEVADALGEPPAPAVDPDVVPADDAGEDVLEETPDFLQETPEHDRLWFEQKPPKDFDF